MGFSQGRDGDGRAALRFRCQCGMELCDRVEVRRPDGAAYVTEFVRCRQCRLLYHWPGPLPASVTSAGLPASYGMPLSEPHPALADAELMARIDAASARARRSRRRR